MEPKIGVEAARARDGRRSSSTKCHILERIGRCGDWSGRRGHVRSVTLGGNPCADVIEFLGWAANHPALVWPAAGLLLMAAALVLALLVANPRAVLAQTVDCTDLVVDQDGDYTPGAVVDFDLQVRLRSKLQSGGIGPASSRSCCTRTSRYLPGFDKEDVIDHRSGPKIFPGPWATRRSRTDGRTPRRSSCLGCSSLEVAG